MTDEARATRKDQAGRRQEIVDAAATIFHEKGFAATTIQDVAEAVDILKGSLYYYIDTKDDLLFSVIHEVHEGGLRNLEEGKTDNGSALDKIHTFVCRHASYNAANLVKMTVFFQDFRSLSDERRPEIIEERDLYDRHLRTLIGEGQREGSIRADVNPKIAAFWILGGMNWMYQWYHPDGARPLDAIAEEFADLAASSLRDPAWDAGG